LQQEIAQLQKRWQDEGRFYRLRAGMSLEREGVVLGAKTVLAKRLHDGSLEGEDARILTLLSVAYGQPVDPSVVGAIRRASKHARAGDECMASMHIALAPLPQLRDPSEAARRLFIADGLMEDGVSPRDIWITLDFDSAPLDALEKEFNPDQPRVPAGSGRPSGQWTREGSDSEAAAAVGAAYVETARDTVAWEAVRATIATIGDWAGFIARYGSGPATFVSAMLYSPPAGGGHHEGEIPGRPDLRYSWNGDETELDIVQLSNGQVVMRATLGADGKFKNRGLTVARETRGGVLVDAAALPSGQSQPKAKNKDDEPELCPEPPVKDKAGLVGPGGDPGRDYQQYMRERINPLWTTQPDYTYALSNPEDNGAIVYYDDCQHEPGMVNEDGTINLPGSMIEYKSPGYATMLAKKGLGVPFKKSLEEDWPKQGLSQIEASHGRPVIWYFGTQSMLDLAREMFSKDKRLQRIQLKLGTWWSNP